MPGQNKKNQKEFELQIDQFGEFHVRAGSVKLFHSLCQRLLRKLVGRNPVGKPELWKRRPPRGYKPGKSKGNWIVSLNYFDDKERTSVRDTEGSATIRKGLRVIKRATLDDIVLIQNNVKYIAALNNGSSSQAPAGWVNMAFAEIAALKR